GRQKMSFYDETIAVEAFTVLGRDQSRQSMPARGGEPARGRHSCRMQPVLVEPAIADNRVAREELLLREDLGKPKRHQQALTHERRHCPVGPLPPTVSSVA